MLKLQIISIGKTKEKWLEEAFNEYSKRLKSLMQISTVWVKDDKQLIEKAEKETSCIALDPEGIQMNSHQFSNYIQKAFESGGSKLSIVIGGAQGLPSTLKTLPLVSLSSLTFTHQITRLVLIEQVYRALEIQQGSNYHK